MDYFRRKVLLITFSAIALFPFSGARNWAQQVEYGNVPDEISVALGQGNFLELYNIDASLNPFYLRGDFDGDGKFDYALRIKSKSGQAAGIAIWLSSLHRFVILGAGTPFKLSGSVATNLDFLNTWQVYGKRTVERGVDSGPPPRLLGEAILTGKRESASGLIYWNGKSFFWYQQGD